MAGALEGIRVIDLTMWFQGPVAAQHLADLGAEVIHVESPKGGDLARGIRSIKALPVGEWNQYFQVINRNKKSMAIDLNNAEALGVMRRLVEESDVFITNLSAKALAKWQVTYEQLSKINPRLVYAMGSGYGPYGNISKPSFDMTVQALLGLMTRQGEPGQPPVYLGMGSGDAMGGMMAALGVMLALNAREDSGRGQFLDASLYGAQLFMAAPSFQAYLATGSKRYSEQRSRREPDNPLWNTYPTRDRWLFLCMENTDEGWEKICKSLDGTGPAGDPRFDSGAGRAEHAAAVVAALDEAFAKRGCEEWMQRWSKLGVVASPIVTFAELAQDPQVWANDYLIKAHCGEVDREVTVRGMPVGFSKTPGEITSLGPELGQDTELILFETLGYDWDKIGELKAQGVIL